MGEKIQSDNESSNYSVKIDDKCFIDASQDYTSLGRYANHSNQPNICLKKDINSKCLILRANTNIGPNLELCWNYGVRDNKF